ncbi:MAG TPA: 1-acyl-sn-glycerol-3-phosphate acyltransferase [Candidatus Binatia bacterium]|nr:1-acyl-sn-glycerol-3-phosphate acyltransferase [Candidatus Binatia bacterium]
MAAPTITLDVGAESVPRQIPEPSDDPFGLDPALRERVLPAVRFLHDRYWRVEVTGAHHLPESGAALVVSNHSGALPFDGAMIVTAVELARQRTLRFLYDRFVEQIAPVASFYNKVGGAVATRENAVRLLQMGELLLVFPEGVSGVAKPFGDRYRLRPFSPGFARLALALDLPVVPVAVVGAEEIYPLVGRAEGVGKMLGMPYVPVTPFFPLLGMLGALPLPTKWFIHFGKPIRLLPAEGEARWQRARHEAIRLRRTIQTMVARLKRRRQSVFFG